ncbi:MAG TPA: right-handed parallel beta-helix repeat-containing protein [Thermoanaerobaculia bacterium]|nr:right-handed parallel beta-helix repeat-containing protein [Thermoanaerobaculia bacterium]
MRKTVAILSFTLALVVAPSLFAQATRTWVSGVGDDANPCSRTAPCKTFAGAISKTAAGGEISVLDPGGYGAVNITKSITLNGAGTLASILFSGTNGIIVNGAGIIVNIKDISLNGGTPTSPGINGIRIIQAAVVHVIGCDIFNYSAAGIMDERTTAGTLVVSNTHIHNAISTAGNTALFGIRVTPTGAVTTANQLMVDNVVISNNNLATSNGIFISNGGKGLVNRSTFTTNFRGIFGGSGGTVEIAVNDCVFLNNSDGIRVAAGANVRLSNNLITGGVNGINLQGGTVSSFGNNHIAGNSVNNGAGLTAIVPAEQ